MAMAAPLASLLLLLLLLPSILGSPTPSPSPLLSFLQQLQSASLASLGPSNFDPKTYVDLPLRYSLPATESAFQRLPRLPNGTFSPGMLRNFVAEYFYLAGSDLVAYTPSDFVPEPKDFLPLVKSKVVRNWALQVHSVWLQLSRKVAPSVKKAPEKHTLLPLPNGMIVPGSRFREIYYWDSYWVVRGLIVSKMLETARGVVENLISLANIYGFVPNGARAYYENRSQPPLLSAMVRALYMATGDLHLLKKSLPVLIKEHSYWISDPHQVIIVDKEGLKHFLSRYYANWDAPRPESYTIDIQVANGLPKRKRRFLYHDIASAAESGWDFSSRWMGDKQDLTTLRTSSIIPVDLNAYLLQMEKNIGFFAKVIENNTVADHFFKAAKARELAMNLILWSDDMGQWLDYLLHPLRRELHDGKEVYVWHKKSQNSHVFASNFVPIWCGALPPGDARMNKLIDSFRSSGLLHDAGIATSLNDTSQQWDFPNAWAPLQHMIIEGLAFSGSARGKALAETIAQRWLTTNFEVFKKTGKMQEKYDAQVCGKVGYGGEYTLQTGFGWTNGVVLTLLHHFGWPEDMPICCNQTECHEL